MVSVYKFLVKLLLLVLNLMFVMQIILLGLVFFSTSYWFFDLIGSQVFAFAEPLASSIIDFMKLFYQHDIEVGGVVIDGSLLLFGIIALILVFVLAKSKGYIYSSIDSINIARGKCEQKIEENFNKELEQEAKKHIMKCGKCAMLIQFNVKNMQIEMAMDKDLVQRTKEKEDETFLTFYKSIKSLEGCKIARTGEKILIQFDDVAKVDASISFVEVALNRLKTNLRSQRWLLFYYASIEVYENNQEFKETVYPFLEKLLALKCKNEMICSSAFKMRYDLNKSNSYSPFLKGSYDINGKIDIWALVKKD